jgi:peptidoglycan/LPS O-acetylase OafA/YrhL
MAATSEPPSVVFNMENKNEGQRWKELDAIRGIAACIVVFWHFYRLLSPETFPIWIQWVAERTPLYLFISGTESVMLFFLLSGFVLSLPYQRNPNHLGYAGFIVKRIARVYLPYLAALLVAVLGNLRFHGLAINSWFIQTWAGPVDPGTLLQHILFLGNYDFAAFNNAFWSLVYEMRISLIFPILCILVIRIGWFKSLLLAAGLAFSSILLRFAGVPGQTGDTLKYMVFFVVGILLARYIPSRREWLGKTPKRLRFAAILLALLCYAYGHLFANVVKDTMLLVGASGILVAGISEPSLSRILTWPVFQFLGRISYSIYLLHVTILYLLAYVFYQHVQFGWLFIPLLTCVLVASTIFYFLVEKPSIRLGRWLASRLKKGGNIPQPVASKLTPIQEPATGNKTKPPGIQYAD